MGIDDYGEWVSDYLLAEEWVFRFAIIGLVGFALENIVLYISVTEFGLFPTVGALFGKEVATVFMFVTNNKWTFSGHGVAFGKKFLMKLAHSHGIRLVGGIISLVILHLLVTLTSIWYIIANMIGIAVGFVFNYAFEHLYVWKTHKPSE